MNNFNAGQVKTQMKKVAAQVNFKYLYLNAVLSPELFSAWKLAHICPIKVLLAYILSPDPVPVDLATAECQVDMSKLVSVTKLTTTSKKKPPPPASRNRRVKEVPEISLSHHTQEEPANKKKITQRQPTKPHGANRSNPAKLTEKTSLSDNLKKYVELMSEQVSRHTFVEASICTPGYL